MPLQSSGPISFADIRDEFGGTGSVSLINYFRGGVFVDNDTFVTSNVAGGNIPASGPLSLRDFMGTTSGKIYSSIYSSNFSRYNPPANAIRVQVQLTGGGGGSVANANLFGLIRQAAAAGGGGGGYLIQLVVLNQANGDYVSGEVGSGGAGTTALPGAGGAGSSSLIRIRNSQGTVIRSSSSANGGGGGAANSKSGIHFGGTAGLPGGARGTSEYVAVRPNQSIVTGTGGAAGNDVLEGGEGGSARDAGYGLPTAGAGNSGRARLRF